MFRRYGGVVLLLLVSCIAASTIPDDLPDRVSLKTRYASFVFDYYVAVSSADGRIYVKPINNTANWFRLPPNDGLPEPATAPNAPDWVSELTCDGNDLVVVANATNAMYFYRFSSEHGNFPAGWQPGGFGQPFPQHLVIPTPEQGRTAFAISQRGYENAYFTDIAGNEHAYAIGCDGVNVVVNGTTIYLVDNWSVPDLYLFEIATPNRNRFVIDGYSVSSSTLFVISERGTMWTRLADFDVLGYDPLLEYTYDDRLNPNPAIYNPIVLPSDDWRLQPIIDTQAMGGAAAITSFITIVQNGVGNAARELRVGGVDAAGTTGYYSKSLYDSVWSFVADSSVDLTGHPFLINDQTPVLTPPKDADYPVGPVVQESGWPFAVTLSLRAFQRFCTPATVQLSFPSDDASNSTTTYELLLHHLFMWPFSGKSEIGSLSVPLNMSTSGDARTQFVWKQLLSQATNITVGIEQPDTDAADSDALPPVVVSALFVPIKWQFTQ